MVAMGAGISTHPVRGQTGEETSFTVRVENVSAGTSLPTPFTPGVWAVHSEPGALFQIGEADRGVGLEAVAEDGNPGLLGMRLAEQANIASSGVFNTPLGSSGPGPLLPGSAYEFVVTATPAAPRLSVASMLVRTNDIFAAPAEDGILLFESDGTPIAATDLTTEFLFWDSGTELNEAPGLGPSQAPLQPGPNTGAREGVVAASTSSTRTLPLPTGIVEVEVRTESGGLAITLKNVSAQRGALTTPIAPLFWTLHDETWSLFTPGEAASGGLEGLAEDGGPGGLVAEAQGATGVDSAGAQPIPLERPDADPGPAMSGESFQVVLPLDPAFPRLSIAAMVVETNDVFLAFGPEGVELYGDAGTLRPMEEIQADVARTLAIWDAGTEANQVPGVGVDQAPRQSAANTGDADPIAGVRLYDDVTNDLAGENVGGFAEMTVAAGQTPSSLAITVTNRSGDTSYPGILTPVVWVVHDSTLALFQVDEAASPGLEELAEDGSPSGLATAIAELPGRLASGVANLPLGSQEPGPLFAGDSYTFEVTPDASHPYLSVASMVVPSNDTFAAFGPSGVRLVDEGGAMRPVEDIVRDFAAELIAWDAGTERNQAGAAGPDQAPRQAGPNTGADEGNGEVRELSDPVWSYPKVAEVLRVTVEPLAGAAASFRRGDGNSDGTVDMSDVLFPLNYLFLGGTVPVCERTADSNDDGRINIVDPVFLANHLFRGTAAPPPPYESCGADTTTDRLECASNPTCEE